MTSHPQAASPPLSQTAPSHDSTDADLANFLLEFYNRPYDFVLACYCWGEVGTGLEKYPGGPDEWQTEALLKLQTALLEGAQINQAIRTAIQVAVKAGHGVGKTAFLAWVVHWFMSTRADPQVVVTAGTAVQLESKMWREIAVWQKHAINGHWFEWTATSYYLRERPDTWKARAIPWSENRADAFAGTHAENVLIVFDEGSAIADIIYDTVSGALTTAGAIFLVMGNPTKNTGMFHRIFHQLAHRWIRMTVDSRRARMVNSAQVQQWLEDYGEDSDYFRVRVRGEFPRASSSQFFDNDLIAACMAYKATDWMRYPVIVAVDVARFGDDASVITIRQGRKRLEKKKYRGMDVVRLAEKVAEAANHYQTDEKFKVYIIVDGVGVGGGVVDVLRSRGFDVIDVNSGERADNSDVYFNKRAEMAGRLRALMKDGLELSMPDGSEDTELADQLRSIEYGFTDKNQIQLEKKDDMKKRLGHSPDDFDSLALTCAVNLNDAEGVAYVISTSRFIKAGGGMQTTQNWRKSGGGLSHGKRH